MLFAKKYTFSTGETFTEAQFVSHIPTQMHYHSNVPPYEQNGSQFITTAAVSKLLDYAKTEQDIANLRASKDMRKAFLQYAEFSIQPKNWPPGHQLADSNVRRLHDLIDILSGHHLAISIDHQGAVQASFDGKPFNSAKPPVMPDDGHLVVTVNGERFESRAVMQQEAAAAAAANGNNGHGAVDTQPAETEQHVRWTEHAPQEAPRQRIKPRRRADAPAAPGPNNGDNNNPPPFSIR